VVSHHKADFLFQDLKVGFHLDVVHHYVPFLIVLPTAGVSQMVTAIRYQKISGSMKKDRKTCRTTSIW